MESVTTTSPDAPDPGPADQLTLADVLDHQSVTLADLLGRITEIRVMLARIEGKLSAQTRPCPHLAGPASWGVLFSGRRARRDHAARHGAR